MTNPAQLASSLKAQKAQQLNPIEPAPKKKFEVRPMTQKPLRGNEELKALRQKLSKENGK